MGWTRRREPVKHDDGRIEGPTTRRDRLVHVPLLTFSGVGPHRPGGVGIDSNRRINPLRR
jgi:hypothetical protein